LQQPVTTSFFLAWLELLESVAFIFEFAAGSALVSLFRYLFRTAPFQGHCVSLCFLFACFSFLLLHLQLLLALDVRLGGILPLVLLLNKFSVLLDLLLDDGRLDLGDVVWLVGAVLLR